MVPMKLCCSINTFAFCYYCNEKWCTACWWECCVPSHWVGSKCPVVNRLMCMPRGGHATYDYGMFRKNGILPEYKEEYDRSIINPKDKWDYEVASP